MFEVNAFFPTILLNVDHGHNYFGIRDNEPDSSDNNPGDILQLHKMLLQAVSLLQRAEQNGRKFLIWLGFSSQHMLFIIVVKNNTAILRPRITELAIWR